MSSVNSTGLPFSSVISIFIALRIFSIFTSAPGSSTSSDLIHSSTSLASLKTLPSVSTRSPFSATVYFLPSNSTFVPTSRPPVEELDGLSLSLSLLSGLSLALSGSGLSLSFPSPSLPSPSLLSPEPLPPPLLLSVPPPLPWLLLALVPLPLPPPFPKSILSSSTIKR